MRNIDYLMLLYSETQASNKVIISNLINVVRRLIFEYQLHLG